jgi:hypothetical protein
MTIKHTLLFASRAYVQQYVHSVEAATVVYRQPISRGGQQIDLATHVVDTATPDNTTALRAFIIPHLLPRLVIIDAVEAMSLYLPVLPVPALAGREKGVERLIKSGKKGMPYSWQVGSSFSLLPH